MRARCWLLVFDLFALLLGIYPCIIYPIIFKTIIHEFSKLLDEKKERKKEMKRQGIMQFGYLAIKNTAIQRTQCSIV